MLKAMKHIYEYSKHQAKTTALAVFLLTNSVGSYATGQSMQVIGGSSMAKSCYQAAVTATLRGNANRLDVEICDRAISHGSLLKTDLVATYVNRGVVQVAKQDYRLAAKDYNRAIGLAPDVAEAYLNRGNLWFLAEKFSEAIEDYDRCLELSVSKSHVAFLNRGMAREASGQLEGAQQDYLAALQVVEDWSVALDKLDRVNKKITKK
jgi:tetratricopeptide (TPR) repeat protein